MNRLSICCELCQSIGALTESICKILVGDNSIIGISKTIWIVLCIPIRSSISLDVDSPTRTRGTVIFIGDGDSESDNIINSRSLIICLNVDIHPIEDNRDLISIKDEDCDTVCSICCTVHKIEIESY